jgi:regulation of enolase protein 1 (concanavalin A-like superfamily)
VSQFIENAREIFEAAENSAAAGVASVEYTILLGAPRGGIHMIANSDWSLSALQQQHGAQLAYRVSQANGRVTVDGREGQRTCRMEADSANRTAQFLLNAVPAWHAPSYAGLLA